MRRVPRLPRSPLARRAAVLLAALLLFAGRPAPGEEGDPLAAPVRAILLEDDVGLRKVYDGVRKGLELAQLPRVGLESLPDTPEAFAAYARRAAAAPPPLLFLIGRRAAERATAAGIGGPRVFVYTALGLGGEELPAALAPAGPAAVVRAVTPVERWGEVVRGLFPGGDPVPVALARAPTEASSPGLSARLAAALGVRFALPGESARALLDLRLGPVAAEAPSPGSLPVLSDDVGRWGRGAAVLLVPDHHLVGRMAAEAGRRLLREAPAAPLRLVVGVTQVRVDLDAARAASLGLPLPFLAHADLLRGRASR